MTNVNGFLIYAALIRLAIIGAGIAAIYLGYRLFLHGTGSAGRTEAAAKGGGFELTVKNAAPGTVFALFGAVIIGIMLITGSPELVINELAPVAGWEKLQASESGPSARKEIRLKGSGEAPSMQVEQFRDFMDQAMKKQRAGDDQGALESYAQALALSEVPLGSAAEAFNETAWLYQKHGDLDAALVLSRMAVRLGEENGAFQHTLAELLLKRDQTEEALERARKAATLVPSAEHFETASRALEAAGDLEGALDAMKRAVLVDSSYESKLKELEDRMQ